eukprot:jgi/Hompol1/3961/HPOL_003415-RA
MLKDDALYDAEAQSDGIEPSATNKQASMQSTSSDCVEDKQDDASLPLLLADGKDKRIKSRRMALFRSDKNLINICVNNGITEVNFVAKLDTITSIEMCHFNFPVIECINQFPFLTSLCLIAQDIKEISGLEACINLIDLWICETKLSAIS